MTSKEDTIDKTYHNVVAGYGSVRDVCNQAKENYSSITYNDVKQYMDKLNIGKSISPTENITHMRHRII